MPSYQEYRNRKRVNRALLEITVTNRLSHPDRVPSLTRTSLGLISRNLHYDHACDQQSGKREKALYRFERAGDQEITSTLKFYDNGGLVCEDLKTEKINY